MKTAIVSLFSLMVINVATCVSAKEKYHEVVNAETQDKFEQIVADVRSGMEAGGRYEFVKPDERVTINAKLAEMDVLFKQSGSVPGMKQPEKIQLYNDQEVVNSILTKRDSDRVICENRLPIGSHIPVTSCHTYGQAQEALRGTRHIMDAWQTGPCISTSGLDNGCGGGRK